MCTWLRALTSLREQLLLQRVPIAGAPPLAYGGAQADGFQDTFVADLAVYMEHGMFEMASGVFDNYFTHYVRVGARLNYRGPELAQFGRMLTLTAQYYRYTADAALLLKHASKLVDISDLLLRRRRASQVLPRTDPSHGMMRGIDEADEMSAWTASSSELPHLSFSLEAWRAFIEIAPVWREIGASHARADLSAVAAALHNETAPLLADTRTAMTRSAVPAGGGLVCHPYVAGEGACGDMSTEGKYPYARVSHTTAPYNFRSSEPWRSYSGMLYSGAIDRPVAAEIVQHHQQRSKLSRIGVWSGGPGFESGLMGFTEHGHGYGLLQHELIEPFLLLLFSHAAHVCSRGTWTCFESRRLPNWPPAGGYATPSQAVIPLFLKWLLVWEPPPATDEAEARRAAMMAPGSRAPPARLTLCQGTPRAWLRDGRRIVVVNAPTSSGLKLNVSVVSALGGSVPHVSAYVSALAMHAASASEWEVTLRLRVPDGYRMAAVEVDGKAWAKHDAEEVKLPRMSASMPRCAVRAVYRHG